MTRRVMPLGFLKVGQEAIIRSINGGCGLRIKLSEMGFTQGTKISNVRNDGFGPLVACVMGSRIATGRGMAQKIIVEEIA